MGTRTFAIVQEFLWYNCFPVCKSSVRRLYGRVNGDLLLEDLCHTTCLPGLLQPERQSPQQISADPYLHRRHLNTQRQVWLSLLWSHCSFPQVLLCIRFCLRPQRISGGCGFDSKCDCVPPAFLLGLLLCPWMWYLFLVESNILLSAASCNFGVLMGED